MCVRLENLDPRTREAIAAMMTAAHSYLRAQPADRHTRRERYLRESGRLADLRREGFLPNFEVIEGGKSGRKVRAGN